MFVQARTRTLSLISLSAWKPSSTPELFEDEAGRTWLDFSVLQRAR